MTAITVAATVIVLAAIVLPVAGELQRIHAERTNPLAKLRIHTRRHQVEGMDPSASFSGAY